MAVTLELARPPHVADTDFSRADLEFRGVDHAGPSYEARVFLNNKRANAQTALTAETGYAGSFHIFGHGGCFGDLGHCDIRTAPRDVYDRRPPHPLTPRYKTVIITDALRRLMRISEGETFTVSVIAVVDSNPLYRNVKDGDPLKFDSVSLLTYEAAAPGPQPAALEP